MDIDDLVEALCNNQIEYLEGLSDEEFEQELIDIDVGFNEEGNLVENYEYEEDD